MASLVEQLAQHIDREIARDLKVCKMLLEISQELYVSMNTRKKLIDEFKEKVGSMVDMSSIRFLDGLQYQESRLMMAYEEFSKFLKNTVGFAHSLYYKVPNVELETGLVRASNSKELYYMFDVANAYGWLEMYVDHHDMKLSQYLDNVADTIIMDGVVSKWRGPPKTKHCNKFSVYDLVNCAENEVEYDEESMQIEEDAV
ncbi:hypothetical protein Tco_1492574 [Tanacetum coccineum]